MKLHRTQRWAPVTKLIHPVVQCGFGDNDEMWPTDASEFVKVSQQGNRLQGLSQTLVTLCLTLYAMHS